VTLRLPDIWPIAAPEAYKLHFARWNQQDEPLEVWARSAAEWQGWQAYRPARDDFNRPLIFSVMRFYHEPDAWLFGGIFRVLARHADRYEVELTAEGAGFIGRLKLGSAYSHRATRVNFENHYAGFTVLEILRERHSGRPFPGFEEIDLGFAELETLVRTGRPDWQAALAAVKGIYLITDAQTGRRYVGSACGEGGIWSRWSSYAANGHGGNAELRQLAADATLAYIRHAFRFALLEVRPVGTADEVIWRRESYWKRILLTRDEFGMNRN
jgi:hypothetical protein